MSYFVPTKRHLQEILLFAYNSKKSVVEARQFIINIYGEVAINQETCADWYRLYKSSDFNIEKHHEKLRPVCRVKGVQRGAARNQSPQPGTSRRRDASPEAGPSRQRRRLTAPVVVTLDSDDDDDDEELVIVSQVGRSNAENMQRRAGTPLFNINPAIVESDDDDNDTPPRHEVSSFDEEEIFSQEVPDAQPWYTDEEMDRIIYNNMTEDTNVDDDDNNFVN